MAIGRISGPLLKANLIRDGVDLAFETDLLYLDVINSRIGVNRVAPEYDLDVNGTARTTNLIVDNLLEVGNFSITGNNISSTLDTISFIPSGGDPTVYHSRLVVDDIQVKDNVISTIVSNSNLELRPNGTGILEVFSSTKVNGDLTVTGNIDVTGNVTIKGNIQIGDALTDTVVINAAIKSDLIPETDNTYDLGSTSFKWKDVYARNLYATNLYTESFDVGNLNFTDTTISTTTNSDLILDPTGTGRVRLGNFAILGNTITNVATDAVTQLVQSGTGYFQIVGTNGFIPPVGDAGNRPTSYMSASTIGMTRYNTASKALELWDGITWASPAGTSGAVSETGANDIAIRIVLTFG